MRNGGYARVRSASTKRNNRLADGGPGTGEPGLRRYNGATGAQGVGPGRGREYSRWLIARLSQGLPVPGTNRHARGALMSPFMRQRHSLCVIIFANRLSYGQNREEKT